MLLGVPRRVAGGDGVFLTPGRATHVAAFLALRGDWVSRDELVALLWPDTEPRRARHTLSQLLHTVRRSAWGHDLEIDTTRLRWPVDCDVVTLRRAVADGDWVRAVELDSGSLLEGTQDGISEAFDAWLQAAREDLRETRREALLGLAHSLAGDERWADAARVLRRLLADDDLHEEAVQALIRAEARAGRRDAALQAFEAFRARLADDLGLEPLEATAALVSAVRRGELDPADAPGSAPDASADAGAAAALPADAAATDADVRPGPVAGLGSDATPFVGRSLDLAELHALARRATHRLVTIAGPGGTGKSRLAGQFARERAGHYEDGAAWVALGVAAGEADVVAAVAAVLGLRIEARVDALVAALADGERLLVLDEVEHLAEAPGLVADLLDGCPRLDLLVTSRTALDVPGEATVRLAGLSLPPDDAAPHGETYDAVALLVRAVQRVRAHFNPSGGERRALVALARVLDGNPLAIELAAAWMRSLEPSEVFAEVERDLAALHVDTPAGGTRHASLGSVFESSWTLLTAGDREALRRLSVFRGGVTRASAAEVVDVPINALLTLTNRSLVQRDRGARFVVPTVIRHFAAAKLAEDPRLEAALARRHEAWALALAREADAALDTPAQPEALQRLDAEQANLTRALETAFAGEDEATVRGLAVALARSWRWRGRVREGLAWFARLAALPASEAPGVERVRSDLAHGLLMAQVGDYEGANAAFERALEDARTLGDAGLEAAARCDLAIIAWRRGDLARARSLFEAAVATYRALGADASLAGTLGNLGTVVRDAGAPDAAHAFFDEAIAIAERLGHVWEVANVRSNKAIAFAYGGDLEWARGEFERTLEAQRSIGDRPGVGRSLTNLGNVHLDTGDEARARELYLEALDLVRALVAQAVSCFLDLAVARGDMERALALAGAVRSMCDAIGVPLTPPQRATYEAARAAALAVVPEPHASDLARRGAALGERDAVAFALGERVAAGA